MKRTLVGLSLATLIAFFALWSPSTQINKVAEFAPPNPLISVDQN